jgi:hypothetical protein
VERVVVRSFGTVAAVAAAALALMIGFLAFSAHQNQQNASRPPGSQASAPAAGHRAPVQAGRYEGIVTFLVGRRASTAPASGAAAGGTVFVAPSGGRAFGATAPASGASFVTRPASCTGLLSSLLGVVTSLLAGSGC